MAIRENEFAIPFFIENDFARKKCRVCGSYYWTQDRERSVCGDSGCQEYTFIGKPPTRRSYTLREVREAFLSFFEKNGHTVIKPYPVVARWRDDVYLVGASIYDFQPYVTDGIAPPPANPLVISQPCLRFTDIDNVGPTAGRHLLIFEMGGHHAFNYPGKNIYWKDETIRYHHELLTEELGVKSERVSYKEHFWSGGGNAGPDVEACVDGLEISTLVFMVYKVVDDKLVEMPIKTVDTGYGMERWTWLSQGAPSGFHAVYGEVLDRIFSLANVKVDERVIAESAKISGMVSAGADKLSVRKKLADRLELDWIELDRMLTPIESAFAVADHTKALAFMLAEGVIPSNVREGYLSRLLVRRAYRMLKLLGIEHKLLDIMDMQISFWSNDFPNLKEMREEILEALEVEEKKFKRTLERGSELVKRLSEDLKSKGVSDLPLDNLIELYDSHGLVPETVKEMAEKEGMKVNVPSNFYGIVAQRHMTAPAVKESELIEKLKDKISGLPATSMLYYKDPYMKRFEAKVLALLDGRHVVLDQTCFYPEGGGALSDRGTLTFENGLVNVVDVQKIGNVVVHVLEKETPKLGETVIGQIDWERRLSLMRHHTATHILIGAVRRILGEHAWQAGAQKDVDKSRLDITHYERLTDNQLSEIERTACEVIMEDIPVETMWMPREEAERVYGFRLYQGGAVPGRELRIVKIGEWDVEACGGVHCRRTGEVGLLKILRADRIQDGVERIVFAAGLPAIQAIQVRERLLLKTAEALRTPVEKVDEAAETLVKKTELLTEQIEQFKKRVTSEEAEKILKKSRRIGRIKLAVHKKDTGDEDESIMLSNKIVEADPSAVSVIVLVKEGKTVRVVVRAGKEAVKAGVHAGKLASELAKIVGGGGGGKQHFGQGGGTKIEKADELIKTAFKILSKSMER
jgi:alanyl-tRNA synthetase